MSEQTMKILKMLEDGKITAAEASELLSKVEELEEKESGPDPRPHPRHERHFGMPHVGNIPIPTMPQIPDINKIVNDALRGAFSEGFSGVSFEHEDGPTAPHAAARGTQFAGARLEHTDLTDTKLDSNTRLQGADLRFASFADADLRGANLEGANLSYSDFSDTTLNGANLQGAQLHHGVYMDTDFGNADLRGADLSMSDISDASFRNVKQPGLSLRGVTLVGVNYEGAYGDAEPQPAHAAEEAAVDLNEAGGIDDVPQHAEAAIPEPPAPPEPPQHSEDGEEGPPTVF